MNTRKSSLGTALKSGIRTIIAAIAAPITLSALAQSLGPIVPGPAGLVQCSADDRMLISLKRAVPPSGTLSGCFKSQEMVDVPTSNKTTSRPRETGFSIVLRGPNGQAYTKDDIDRFYSQVQEQWRNVKPLWDADRSRYEQSVENLINRSTNDAPQVKSLSINQPILISMNRVNDESIVVVSVRHLSVKTPAGTLASTRVEGTALVLNYGNLIRLSLLRELQTADDAEAVKNAITSWAADVEMSPQL